MSEPFVGEIRMFAGTFAPSGWAFCDGQLLAIYENNALFSLLGTNYGGDGQTTFGLPDLRGRMPMHAGYGPGLSPRRLAEKIGSEEVTLIASQLPSHTHRLRRSSTRADATSPVGHSLASSASGDHQFAAPGAALVDMHSSAVASTGGGQAHPNLPPFVCIHFIIALYGIYPSRP